MAPGHVLDPVGQSEDVGNCPLLVDMSQMSYRWEVQLELKNKLASFISTSLVSVHAAMDLVRSTECAGSGEGLHRFLYKREGSTPQPWSRTAEISLRP